MDVVDVDAMVVPVDDGLEGPPPQPASQKAPRRLATPFADTARRVVDLAVLKFSAETPISGIGRS